jgi:glyoxylase I family protein
MIDLVDAGGPLGREGSGPPDHPGPNVAHFCLRVEPFDANAIVGHLHRHGIEPSEVGIRFGADGEGPSSSLYLHDPEGNRIELKGPPSA